MTSPLPRLTATRRLIFAQLLDDPQRHWTVRNLAAALPADAQVSAGTVRDLVNVLLANRLLEQVPGQRTLTVVLTSEGRKILPAALARPNRPDRPDER